MSLIPQTQVIINDKIIDTSAIPYMRRKVVAFAADSLRPGAIVDCYFDGIKVLSNQLVDTSGNLAGNFTIPIKMPVGTKNFEIYDTSESTSANAPYTAGGSLQTRQKTITSVRHVEEIRTVIQPVRRKTTPVWVDPLAQSFLVDSSGGAFLTSIDIFFKTKDTSLPVSLYIVEMQNGFPTSNILPFSKVTKAAATVTANTSVPASGLTKFTFSDPIYVEDATEYAFVLFSDSDNYTVWISTLGNVDIASGTGIAKQPYLGSMFKSQNSTTWSADQLSDIKFAIHKAKFDTASSGTVTLNNPNDFNFNLVHPKIEDLILPDTLISYTHSIPGEAPDSEFINGSDITFVTTKNLTATQLSLKGTLTTSNENISPVIDIDRMGAVGILNKLDANKSDPDLPGFVGAGTYISQGVNLINPASSLKVLVNAQIPTGSQIRAFFRTQETILSFLTLNNGAIFGAATNDLLLQKQINAYKYVNQATAIEKLGRLIVTGFDGTKIFYRSASNTTMFIDTGTLFLSDDDALEAAVINDSWNIATSYAVGDYIRQLSSGRVFKLLTNIPGGSLATEPSVSNPDWKEVSIISYDGVTGSTEEITNISWRPMVIEGNSVGTLDPSNAFLEYRFKPKIETDSEFTSFAVKIESFVNPSNAGHTPAFADIRAIAVF